MKKLITIILMLILISNLTFAEDLTSTDVSVVVDGELLNTVDLEQNINLPVLIYNNRTMIPLRNTFDMFGISGDQITWDPVERAVEVVTNNGDNIWMQIDNLVIYFNGKALKTDVPAKIFNNRTYVPIAMVSNLLGTIPEWNAETRTVIMKPGTYKLTKFNITFEYPRSEGYVLRDDFIENKTYYYQMNDLENNTTPSMLSFTMIDEEINVVFSDYLYEQFLGSEDFVYLTDVPLSYSREQGEERVTFVKTSDKTLKIVSIGMSFKELRVLVDSIKEVM
ncbi:MAG: copper amine oxidase N-terminal domain-containing protein [Clostridiales bacterium]|nr:copper amine oxidase N-terminal domain-containing protein [Clostridiales bacterium]